MFFEVNRIEVFIFVIKKCCDRSSENNEIIEEPIPVAKAS